MTERADQIRFIYMGPVNVCLKVYIKFSTFRNIFLEIEKVIITFSILEKFFFSKMEINVCPKGTY